MATSPFDGALTVGRITTSPDTNANVHRSLGEARTTLGILVVQSADLIAVNEPLDVVLLPLNLVGVEFTLDVVHSGPGVTVIGGSIALTEVVGLNGGVVPTKGFPVNLIEIIRLEDNGANNAGTGGSLHGDLDFTVEDVEVGLDGRSITLLVDSELSTIGASVNLAGSGRPLVEARALSEVELGRLISKTLVRWARLLHGVAVGVSLGRNQRSHGGESHGGILEERVHREEMSATMQRLQRMKSKSASRGESPKERNRVEREREKKRERGGVG